MKVKLTQAIRARWLKAYGHDSLAGNCRTLCNILSNSLHKHNIPHKMLSGYIHTPSGRYAHTWIVAGNWILDPAQLYTGCLYEPKTRIIRYANTRFTSNAV